MAIHLQINQPVLNQVGVEAGTRLVNRVVRRTLNRSAVLCPVYSGNLRGTGQMNPAATFGNQVRGGVEYTADYAMMVHDGTPPHVIQPKRARSVRNPRRQAMLRFEVDGQVVFAREVRHPGTKPRPFLTDALRQVAEPEGFRVTIG